MKKLFSIIFTILLIAISFTACSESYYLKNNQKNMLTIDEYIELYKKSGLDYSVNQIDEKYEFEGTIATGPSTHGTIYENEEKGIRFEYAEYEDYIQISTHSTNGVTDNYEYLLSPIYLYIKDLSGAIIDTNKLIKKFNNAPKGVSFSDDDYCCFDYKGIRYSRVLDEDTLTISVRVYFNNSAPN